MSQARALILGEYSRVFDDRYRIALPPECVEKLLGDNDECVLAKEREGCLSLWSTELWNKKFGFGVDLIQVKLQSEFLEREMVRLQRLSRLLSTRSRPVKLGQKSRLLVPEGFREFLGVEPNGDVLIVGAGVCLEIWNPAVWHGYLRQDIGEFHSLFAELAS